MKEKKNKVISHLRNDVILVVLLLAISALAFVYLFMFRKGGDTVKVTVDGREYGTYSLSQDISKDIVTGENGDNFNSFVINDGKVYMSSASCPDGICVNHSAIFRDGESIVCLPNRVVITVISDGDGDCADIVA